MKKAIIAAIMTLALTSGCAIKPGMKKIDANDFVGATKQQVLDAFGNNPYMNNENVIRYVWNESDYVSVVDTGFVTVDGSTHQYTINTGYRDNHRLCEKMFKLKDGVVIGTNDYCARQY